MVPPSPLLLNVSSHLIAMLCDFVNSTNIPISRRSTQPCSHADLPKPCSHANLPNLALPLLLCCSHRGTSSILSSSSPFLSSIPFSSSPFLSQPFSCYNATYLLLFSYRLCSASSQSVMSSLNNINSDLPSVCYVLINTINSDLPSVCYVLINNINSDLPSVCYVLINNINLTYSLINNINSNLPLTRALISLTNAVMQI